MRYLPFLAIAVSSFAFANTPGDFSGKNKRGLTFSINMDSSDIEVKDGDEIWKPRYISVYQVRTKGKYLIPFNERQLPSNCWNYVANAPAIKSILNPQVAPRITS
jgi:hypothetical protein